MAHFKFPVEKKSKLGSRFALFTRTLFYLFRPCGGGEPGLVVVRRRRVLLGEGQILVERQVAVRPRPVQRPGANFIMVYLHDPTDCVVRQENRIDPNCEKCDVYNTFRCRITQVSLIFVWLCKHPLNHYFRRKKWREPLCTYKSSILSQNRLHIFAKNISENLRLCLKNKIVRISSGCNLQTELKNGII
jgi:hypothetical protein